MRSKAVKNNIKPIQNTPALSGQDVKRILLDMEAKESVEAVEKNRFLQQILNEIYR